LKDANNSTILLLLLPSCRASLKPQTQSSLSISIQPLSKRVSPLTFNLV
jgi:hypothetical protein